MTEVLYFPISVSILIQILSQINLYLVRVKLEMESMGKG
jgi:hypothetical protein